MEQLNRVVIIALLLTCALWIGPVHAQAAKAKAKEPAVKEETEDPGGLSEAGKKKVADKMAAFRKERDAAVTKEKGKEPLKGRLKQATTGLDKTRVLGINAIYGLYSEKKISKRSHLKV